ncbi:uncharacterized protein [Magallana gigas]|uniref:uncharacterized protein n=1 Tax=Magallana gigas TaxID=29159 RepID=UPI00333FFE86
MQGISRLTNILLRETKLVKSQSPRNIPQALFSFCSTCGEKSTYAGKRKKSVENLDCVKVDFSKQNFEQQTFSDTISSLTEEFLYDVSTIKPEVILADHIQESQYLMHTRGALRSLGYTGHFSSLQDGRGLGVFVRKDIADNLPIAPGTVYQSYLDTS